ncbi:MAG: hypothetical protein HN904_28810, partial [Victivallales bacterium]|nr:hypothetical protein [Victivallales bacterium]
FGEVPAGLPQPDLSVLGYGRHYTDNWCGVVVETSSGQTHVGYELPARHFAPGGPDLAFARRKFRECAAFDGHFTEEQVEQLIQTVDRLGTMGDIQPLLSLLAG